jgi:hypothetical protein
MGDATAKDHTDEGRREDDLDVARIGEEWSGGSAGDEYGVPDQTAADAGDEGEKENADDIVAPFYAGQRAGEGEGKRGAKIE